MADSTYNTTDSTSTTVEGSASTDSDLIFKVIGAVAGLFSVLGVILAILSFLQNQRRNRDEPPPNSDSEVGDEMLPSTGDDGSVPGAHPPKDPAQVAAESCREALKTRYRTTGDSVQLIPREDDTKRIKDIFTDLTLRESGRKLKSYKDIFSEKRIILKGLAGRGKSTIMNKMAYDWACGEALQQFELVFLLRMREVEQSTDLIDAIFEQLLDRDTEVHKTSLSSFISHNQVKVLILLDGFDELMTPMHALREALFGSILETLNCKRGRDFYVVVTTRTSYYHKLVTESLIQYPFTKVSVEGFDKEDIKKYVKRFYSKEDNKGKRLYQKIKSSNVLSDLAKSPMLLLLMCILWRDNYSTLPDTMSCIYSAALGYIFQRKPEISPHDIPKVTNALGKMGLYGLLTQEQQFAFSDEDFKPSGLESAINAGLESALKAGILTRQKVSKVLTGSYNCNSFQFLHKTFQEFYAGKYLQSLLETDAVEFKRILKQMINSQGNDFEYVLRFCAGDNMACTSSILQTLATSDQIKEEQEDQNANKRLSMQLGLNCYLEGQSTDLPPLEFIQCVLTDRVVVFKWDSDSLNSFTYFLRQVHTTSMDNEGSDYLDKVQSVEVEGCNYWSTCLLDFTDCISLMVNLSSVTMHSCFLYGISAVFAASSGVTSCPVGSAALWAQHFKKMKNLQKLCLSFCLLTGKGMTHIAPALCDLPNLVELNLKGNIFSDVSATPWVHHLKKLKNLQKLDLSYCSVTHKDVSHIAPALCDLPKSVELHLWGNGFTTSVANVHSSHHFEKNVTLFY